MSFASKLGFSIGCLHRTNLARNIIQRKSHVVSYRNGPPPHSKATKIGALTVGGAMWWWVIWHLWHEPDHITGEFEYPNSKKWSNAELGIPKDGF
ncbi:NADH dehydrogenase [ubiquinone] 1 beta subcomplex subunit 2, mitochondrial [Drosophila erecta]|uniref:NADH dehydrogenase [ubiquinone] 1 beta subcomplex subunit 2, mitochondrial n=1 Tax=Drosophila erecta TaxID=7220 RepID=B3NJ55_DROER|nr:NADH dehydrogenase [ubiquinone] 1 beta subcomplex subunit 2, mitochondrial [Drosophila erecta]EDV52838.1 uncharacterized protein Dere_GG16312 [Drosophila erecta]